MFHLDIESLSDCRGDCIKLFNQTRELRGKDKAPIYKTDAYKVVAAKIREKIPTATDREILTYILKKAGHLLRRT